MTNLFSQQQYWDIREEIISRHENGNKKLLVKYSGKGSSEIIIERITYTDNDKIISIEKPIKNIIVFFDYYDNGNVQLKRTYENNLENGIWVFYDKEGKKFQEVNYLHGEINGNSIFYNEKGEVDKDLKIETWDNGQIRFIQKYNFGDENFYQKVYYENGTLHWESINEKQILYYDNGQISRIDIFNKSNEKNGICFDYDIKGNLIYESEYLEYCDIDFSSSDNTIKLINYNLDGSINIVWYRKENGDIVKDTYQKGKVIESIIEIEYDDWDDEW